MMGNNLGYYSFGIADNLDSTLNGICRGWRGGRVDVSGTSDNIYRTG